MPDRAMSSEQAVAAAEAALRGLITQVPTTVRAALGDRVATLLEQHVEKERERCARQCRERAQLWRNTTAATSSVAFAREEARARANEADYLADLLEKGEDARKVGIEM